ncbi:MAG: M15 family metallopeptidase [Ignavibacteriaceae bacterium]
MIRLIISFVTISFFFMNTLAQHNTHLVTHSSGDNTTLLNSSVVGAIIDSDFKLEEALYGQRIPASVTTNLTIVTVFYYGFDEKLHQGQLVVHKEVARDVKDIFEIIRQIHFPIEKVVPICKYKWSDDESMRVNNTSSFNYRFISGSKILSKHASGLAIDINPKQNPYIKNGTTSPAGSVYIADTKGTITTDCRIVEEFKKRGWTWGGDWKSLKDYQHFQKILSASE